MKERRLLLFLTFLPIAMAIFIWDLDSELTEVLPEKTISDHSNLPDTILESVNLSQYDLSGNKSQNVSSELLLSMAGQQKIDINTPVITLETPEGQWIAESRTGEFNQQENRLSLYGDVVLKQEKGELPVEMRTEKLDYHPNSRTASTNSPVVIVAKGHHVESVGIQVDLANSVYILPKKVRSRHEPL